MGIVAGDPDLAALAAATVPVTGAGSDYDGLLDLIGERRVVLIGESSHGTHDFYAERARLTRRLIEECGFAAVAIEGDWPDAYRVHRYVTGAEGAAPCAEAALGGFTRFPAWMWRNRVVLDFVRWLRACDDARPTRRARAGFYGLDLYSLRASMEAVVAYLADVDPHAARLARERYACFDHVGDGGAESHSALDGAAYGYALASAGALPCEREVVTQLVELRERAARYIRQEGDGPLGGPGTRNSHAARESLFAAEQNAVVVKDAEEYYARMYEGGVASWNLRDRHMARTLDALLEHLSDQGTAAKVVVWAHNSHVGDARATTKAARGQLTLGQLVREGHGDDAFLVGLTTYDGEVSAAPDWGRPVHRWRVRPGLPDSHEDTLHRVADAAGSRRFWVDLSAAPARSALGRARLERAIGVVYRPVHERQSHYFLSHLTDRYDALVHLDRTQALEPLDRTQQWDRREPPETYPEGL